MATSTYVPIASYTVSGNTTNTITFSSIPQTYTDLVFVSALKDQYTAGVYSSEFYINNDQTSTYSLTSLYGGGATTPATLRVSSFSAGIWDGWALATPNITFGPSIQHFFDYTNTTTYKTMQFSAAGVVDYNELEWGCNLWRSTAAINRIDIITSGGTSKYYVAGSTVSLYGIKAE